MTKVIDQVRQWLTPTLILIIGYFSKNKLNEIDAKLDLINNIQGQVSVLNVKVDYLGNSLTTNTLAISNLQHDFYEHVAAKKEDEITIK